MSDGKKTVLELHELQSALGLKGFFGKLLARMAYNILELEEVNRVHRKFADSTGPEFSAHVLEEVAVSYEIPEAQLARIPKEGGFISVSNHHFGAVDGMILSSVIGSRRPDYKILTTFLLSLIPCLKDSFIGVDNFSSGGARSISGIRAAIGHIAGGSPLGLFPAGEVATWQKGKNRTAVKKGKVVEDIPWAENIIKLVRKSGFPVIPVYFQGGNSKTFHRLGRIHPRLRTIRLIHELFHMRGTVIQVRIGEPISAEEIAGMDVNTLGKYLRNRCYALEAQCLPPQDGIALQQLAPIDEPVPAEKVRAELEGLSGSMLFETGEYRMYLLNAADAPLAMHELYRLREETFRAVGEGTGLSHDTDPYDSYYRQLVLWNIADSEITGAFRLGFGPEIMASHGGIDGFYSASLFRYGKAAEPFLSKSMELGRSFIVQKHQKESMPLRLLLAGIMVAAAKAGTMKYCSGTVSISNSFPTFYKSLIARFIEKNFPLDGRDEFATPLHPFMTDYLSVNPDDLLAPVGSDIAAFDKLLMSLSDGLYNQPPLVRLYFGNGARLACFNVDPDFSDSLDGLICSNFSEFPQLFVRLVLRSLPDELGDEVWFWFYGTHLN